MPARTQGRRNTGDEGLVRFMKSTARWKSEGFACGKQTWLVSKQMTTRLVRMQKEMMGIEIVKDP